MSLELVLELAQIIFVIPLSQGGGTFKQGQTVVGKSVKPRIIYIVYSGSVRKCSLIHNLPERAAPVPEIELRLNTNPSNTEGDEENFRFDGYDMNEPMLIDEDGVEIRENSFCAVEGLLEDQKGQLSCNSSESEQV